MAGTTVPIVLRRVGGDRLGAFLYFLRRNPRMIVGGTVVLAWLFVASFAPWIAPHDPIKVNVSASLLPPSPGHWTGTRDLGRDVLSRRVWGRRGSLSACVVSVSIGL